MGRVLAGADWRWMAAAVALVAPLAMAERAAPLRPPPPPSRPRPGPARCGDPIEGVWVARKFWPAWHEWTTFTLTIHRTAPGATTLEGTIENHAWTGTAEHFAPPPTCDHDEVDLVVTQPAGGLYLSPTVTFNGTAWSVREHRCRAWERYRLDHFTGSVDTVGETITSTNTDGGRDRDEPYVFHRVRCL